MSTALIIGGGIAGLASAIGLRHIGLDVTVYEAHPTGADGKGAFLTIMANGLDALAAIDAEDLVNDHSFVSRNVRMRTGRDRGLGVLSVPTPGPQREARTLRRADLYRVLSKEARRRGATIELGKRLADVQQDDAGRVTARFTDGTSAGGDLLIGADGVNSVTRTFIDPDAPPPSYVGWSIAYGAVRHPMTTRSRDSYYMYFGRRASCGHITSPEGETWWFANIPCQEGALADASAAVLRRRLADLFSDDDIPTVQAMLATDDTEMTATACYQLPSVPTWHRGHTTLAGDALHVASPVTTQGASMAIEDSVVLAKCLRDMPSIPTAFDAYERMRRVRVERVVASGNRSTALRLPGPLRRLLRDIAVARRARKPRTGWLHLHHIDWSRNAAEELASLPEA